MSGTASMWLEIPIVHTKQTWAVDVGNSFIVRFATHTLATTTTMCRAPTLAKQPAAARVP